MKYFKDRPIGLWILAVSVILFTIYYHIRPFLWGADISIYAPMFELKRIRRDYILLHLHAFPLFGLFTFYFMLEYGLMKDMYGLYFM